MKYFASLLLIFLTTINGTVSQETDYFIPINFNKAYKNQTRSMNGSPGEKYWQNRADYSIDVELEPATHKISGTETIVYTNNSPDNLEYLIIHLFPNLYKKGAARDFDIDHTDAFDGVFLDEITFNGKVIGKKNRSKFVEYIHNNFMLFLPEDIAPGETAKIGFTWNYTLNTNSHYREGQVDKSSFFVAYFFPRIAVYDDIDGWDDWKYSGTAEFYNDFGDYDVSISVPEKYMVWATGEWQNPKELLTEEYFNKFIKSKTSDEIISIIDTKDIRKGNILKQKSKTTWKYLAKNVTDFSFGTSDHYLWDATSLVVDKQTGRRVSIDAAYNSRSIDFYEVASIARSAISYMSYSFPAIPFPYPKMTVFNGLSEMEYPMMVNDISLSDISETIKLTSHEIFHTYFPFYTGLNETKYAWMDEGMTCYGESIVATALEPDEYEGFYFLDIYEENIGYDYDMPFFVNTEFLKAPVYYYNSYPKAAIFFQMVHEYLGNEKFLKALHAFVERWNGKHPLPHDLIFTFEDVLNEDLSWLFRPWIFEFGYVDFAIQDFATNKNTITIEKRGVYPAPFSVLIHYMDGSEDIFDFDAGIWKSGNNNYEIILPEGKLVSDARLLNKSGLDADVSNNYFSAGK